MESYSQHTEEICTPQLESPDYEYEERTVQDIEVVAEASESTAPKSRDIELEMEEYNGVTLLEPTSSCLEEILEIIEMENDILRGIIFIATQNKLNQLITICAQLKSERDEKRVRQYLKEILKLKFDIDDWDTRKTKIADIFFYYLMRNEEPESRILRIIWFICYPLYDLKYNWLELCSVMLGKNVLSDEKTFIQFYKRLENNKTALQNVLSKQPLLLLNKQSYNLVERLVEFLPYENLHQILVETRDENGQTHMFHVYRFYYKPYVQLYKSHVDDLYKLLSICNNKGQTALHVKTTEICELLCNLYTPRHRTVLQKLYSLKDFGNKSALDVADSFGQQVLSSLILRAQNNEYTTRAAWTRVLIMYNTNNRSGAEEEAQIIHNACRSKCYEDDITVSKNLTEEEIIQRISQTSRESWVDTSLIVILMSHGSVGTIDDCNGKPIKLSEIETAMCSDNMSEKPKILITQCCQINAAEIEAAPYVPTHDHFCAIMSCLSGQTSTRGVFISKLANMIRESSRDENIFRLISRVCKGMQDERHEQTPIIMSTLKAQLVPMKLAPW